MNKATIGKLTAAMFAGSTAVAGANEIMVIEVAGQANGVVEIELLSDVAPQHVEQIKQLAKDGAYDGIVFHRVIEGFMAQTGDVQYGKFSDLGLDPRVGTGGSDLPDLMAEFSDVNFEKGVVGMARSQNPNSANSQFFIMFDDAPFLNGQYTVFGRIISGQETVDAIKRGSSANNGVVEGLPDYMAKVSIK